MPTKRPSTPTKTPTAPILANIAILIYAVFFRISGLLCTFYRPRNLSAYKKLQISCVSNDEESYE